ncbi:uncharacterized protein LOC109796037 [Cajanus cajan]|uniref:uncharacterized protein LOC109796037 n=1 Tax=Cajanus cajan TaxID=3821 RepID=UPI00098DAD17|nr:uncharacterized protein LOC109796037 [Cajanus cajan]
MDELRARATGYIQMEEHAEFRNSVRDSFTTKGESNTRKRSKTHIDQRSKRPQITDIQQRNVGVLKIELKNLFKLANLDNTSNAAKLLVGASEDVAEDVADFLADIKDDIRIIKDDLSKAIIIKQMHVKRENQAQTVQIRNIWINPLKETTYAVSSTLLLVGLSEEEVPIQPENDIYALSKMSTIAITRNLSQKHLLLPSFSQMMTTKLDIPHHMIQPYSEPLAGFAGERVHTRDFVELLTSFGIAQNSRRILVKYLLVDAVTSYNILIGRPTLNQLGAIVSTPHLTMKFPGTNGHIIAVKANQQIARKCYAESLKITPPNLQPEESTSSVIAHIGTREMTDLDP